jgi:hypothetical protein
MKSIFWSIMGAALVDARDVHGARDLPWILCFLLPVCYPPGHMVVQGGLLLLTSPSATGATIILGAPSSVALNISGEY